MDLKRTPRFEVYDSSSHSIDQQWRWRLRGGNGEILAVGESYTRERDAKRAVKSVERAVLKIIEAEDLRAIARMNAKR